MVLKDTEGLIFRERKKPAEQADDAQNGIQVHAARKSRFFSFHRNKHAYTENNDHIKFSVFSGLKLGIGIMVGSFIGLVLIVALIIVAATQIPEVSGTIITEKALALVGSV